MTKKLKFMFSPSVDLKAMEVVLIASIGLAAGCLIATMFHLAGAL